MDDQLLYQIALTLIPQIGAVHAKSLLDNFGSASEIFKAKKKQLSCLEGIGEIRANSIKRFNEFSVAEKEMAFLEKHGYRSLFLLSDDYPKRLLDCNDAPILLYYQGNANLNAKHIISIVGTRKNSDYGKQITEQFISELPTDDVLIISGLALGIDAIAHRACIQNKIQTIGVLAHGLDIIYPYQHRSLAKEMLLNGGLITEFRKNTQPEKFNFPKRNRIVAGMSDATVVIETAIKGGSMITAEIAFSYNRTLYVLPARITDTKSGGCLHLIKVNKADLFTGTADFLAALNWQEQPRTHVQQGQLFYEPSKDEAIILALMRDLTTKSIDELHLKSALHYSSVAAAILNLEINQVIKSMPGKTYRLLE